MSAIKLSTSCSLFFICIPSNVENMMQTFSGCNNLRGDIQINANLNGKVVYNWNNQEYKDYDQCFLNACTNTQGVIILKTSTCPVEILNNFISQNSKIQIEI